MRTNISHSEEETKKLAREIGAGLKVPACVCLYGDLGSGKTVFAKGLAEAFGIPEKKVKSPTYTFVRQYRTGKTAFFHFDFYRIEAADDLMARDLEEIFGRKDAVIVVEWPEKVQDLLPDKRVSLDFRYVDANTRAITVKDDRK